MSGTVSDWRFFPRVLRSFARHAAAIGLGALLLAGCSGDDLPAYEERPVAQLYNAGLDALGEGNYVTAAEQFEEVERQHPFSIWAPRAQVMSAYAHFEADAYDDAIINIDRFIQLHPNHEDAPYAHYLKALAYYEQIVDVQRDQAITAQALQALDDVQRRYPDSVYARDAQLKRDLAFDHLAGKEMAIGRFYLRRGKPLAAINRFRSVLRDYQTTTHVPEALHRLVESYTALGLHDEATKTASVLGHNFPGSAWYSDSYFLLTGERVKVKTEMDDRDWIERTWDYLLVPSHTVGAVDLESQPELLHDLNTLPSSAGPTVARLGEEAPKPEADAAPAAPELTPRQPAEAPSLAAPETRRRLESQRASAQAQAETAAKASDGWQKAADAAADGEAKGRAEANAQIARRAARYWQARADLVQLALDDPENENARRSAERTLAERAVTYWQTVAEMGETQTERDLARRNAEEAEKALAFWDTQSRGWLGRLFGGGS